MWTTLGDMNWVKLCDRWYKLGLAGEEKVKKPWAFETVWSQNSIGGYFLKNHYQIERILDYQWDAQKEKKSN